MKTSPIHRGPLAVCARLAALSAVLGAASAAQATGIVTTDSGVIAAFQAGTAVENFDNLTALAITSYSPVDATGFTFSSRNAATSPTFDTGGATAKNPASNPGVPVAILSPTGGIASDVASPNNVAGPVSASDPGPPAAGPFTAFGQTFMEVAMPFDVNPINAIKVGLFVTHGTVDVQIQDGDLLELETVKNVPAGSFVAFTRNSADIRNVSIVSAGAFTIDDFTYAFTSSTTGGGGGGGSTVPDSGHALNLALAACFLGLARWKFRSKSA